MDRGSAIFIAEQETVALSGADAEVHRGLHFEAFVALQDSTHRRLDDDLVDLVMDRAAEFAALTPREQAAIAWVEAVVASGKMQSSDGAYAALRRHFDETAIVKLTALAGTASARAKLGVSRRG